MRTGGQVSMAAMQVSSRQIMYNWTGSGSIHQLCLICYWKVAASTISIGFRGCDWCFNVQFRSKFPLTLVEELIKWT